MSLVIKMNVAFWEIKILLFWGLVLHPVLKLTFYKKKKSFI